MVSSKSFQKIANIPSNGSVIILYSSTFPTWITVVCISVRMKSFPRFWRKNPQMKAKVLQETCILYCVRFTLHTMVILVVDFQVRWCKIWQNVSSMWNVARILLTEHLWCFQPKYFQAKSSFQTYVNVLSGLETL